ncbi:hypothetical protein [Sutcliffiella halmapala]|jgi:membrane protein implicated in regulation of membrane protease activity|uniref:hypothetical protein n=1 Tax=Sutcliffiella halmapala TaxID=79882 RepID=UPI000994F0A4|nr:hypothetical protein [Sutcliffiella halmapala]
MDILFGLVIQLFIGGIMTFCVFAFIQFLLPKFNLLYLLGGLYVIGCLVVIFNSWTQEWLLFTILSIIALFAILTVRFYRYIYQLTEQKANEWKEINL